MHPVPSIVWAMAMVVAHHYHRRRSSSEFQKSKIDYSNSIDTLLHSTAALCPAAASQFSSPIPFLRGRFLFYYFFVGQCAQCEKKPESPAQCTMTMLKNNSKQNRQRSVFRNGMNDGKCLDDSQRSISGLATGRRDYSGNSSSIDGSNNE